MGIAAPEHNVTLTKGFYLGKFEVTQDQYEAVMTGNTDGLSATPSQHGGNSNRPVEKVSWDDAHVFLTRLNEQQADNLPVGWAYVLPTEAQWEYACRAGTTTVYSWGNSITTSDANYNNTIGQTTNVGSYRANPWGFFDMNGNIREWLADWHSAYTDGSALDPVGPASGSEKIIRGGSFGSTAAWLRSSNRHKANATYSSGHIGFRVGFRQITEPPTDLNSTAVLTIAENQPVGSVIGEFNATDPEGGAITFYFVNGENNNSLFTLDTNGTLKTATTFDFEFNASTYTIGVEARDEYNATIEGSFLINLTDDRTEDFDGDGLTQAQEEDQYSTSDLLADTDDDGLSDYEEVTAEHTYEIVTSGSISWLDAKMAAENLGGYLVTITSAEEQSKIQALISGRSSSYWIGASDHETEGTFRWVTGEPFVYENWDANEPSNSGGQNYVQIYQSNYMWDDHTGPMDSYILEKEIGGSTNPLVADSDGDGYKDGLEVSTGSDPNDAESIPIQNGLVAWYPFDGNASDMSGNGNHGTVNGATLGADRHGQANRAYIFNDEKFISLPTQTLGEWAQLTFSVWVKATQYSGNGYPGFIGSYTDTESRNIYLGIKKSSSKLHLEIDTQVGNFNLLGQNELTWNQWFLASLVYNGSEMIEYFNGVRGSSVSASGNLKSVTEINIGKGYQAIILDGSLDDIRIYDRALSEDEIRLLYDAEAELPDGAVTSAKLSPALSDLIDGNGSMEQALPAGSVIARKPGEAPPPGYTLFQRNDYNASHVWEEKASVSVARDANDGGIVLDGKIYFVGGHNAGNAFNLVERYDPVTNEWETLNPLSVPRAGLAVAVLKDKIYAIGGAGLTSVEVYDSTTGQWSAGPSLPSEVVYGTAVSFGDKIFLIGGGGANLAGLNQTLEFDLETNQWSQKAPMPTARFGLKSVVYEGKIWVLGGGDEGQYFNSVEIYDPTSNSWTTGPSLTTNRLFPATWVIEDRIYLAGGRASQSNYHDSIEVFDSVSNQWTLTGNLPENKYSAEVAILNDKLYIIAGRRQEADYSDKVYAADLPPHPINLYFKDGNATAEAELSTLGLADGSVTLGQLAPDALSKIGLDHNPATAEGSLLAVPLGSQPPPGYALYKRSDRNGSLVWEERGTGECGQRSLLMVLGC